MLPETATHVSPVVNQRPACQFCMHFDLKAAFSQKGVAIEEALLFLDQIKREKGVWWMPWQ